MFLLFPIPEMYSGGIGCGGRELFDFKDGAKARWCFVQLFVSSTSVFRRPAYSVEKDRAH